MSEQVCPSVCLWNQSTCLCVELRFTNKQDDCDQYPLERQLHVCPGMMSLRLTLKLLKWVGMCVMFVYTIYTHSVWCLERAMQWLVDAARSCDRINIDFLQLLAFIIGQVCLSSWKTTLHASIRPQFTLWSIEYHTPLDKLQVSPLAWNAIAKLYRAQH